MNARQLSERLGPPSILPAIPSVAFDEAGVADKLKNRSQWMNWRPEWLEDKGHWTKVPCDAPTLKNPEGRKNGAQVKPGKWLTFAKAVRIARESGGRLGIGFALSKDDPFTVVDLDNCIGADGILTDFASGALALLMSYTAISPSGKGLHVWVEGVNNSGSVKVTGVAESYGEGRFMTITGRPYEGCPTEIMPRQAELDEFLWDAGFYRAAEEKAEAAKPRVRLAVAPEDAELIALARAARNGDKFVRLYDGGELPNGDHSAADNSLCSHLAFWTSDPVQMDRIFRGSALMRDKWDRALKGSTYGRVTIDKAIAQHTGPVYNPAWRPEPGALVRKGKGLVLKAIGGLAAAAAAGHGDDGRNENGNLAFFTPANPREPEPPAPNEGEDDPHRLARVYRDLHCSHNDGLTLRFYQGEMWRWGGSSYSPVPDKEIRAEVTQTAKADFDRLNREALVGSDGQPEEKRPKVRKVTTALIANVTQALTGYTVLKSTVQQPAWVDGPAPWPATEVLPTANAIVHLPSFVAGKHAIIKPTPRLFAPHALDYDFVADAPEPTMWLTFLGARAVTASSEVKLQLWPDDPEARDGLQEWMGLQLVPDTRFQKIAALIGPKRCGKGTIARILRAMVGPNNVAGPTLSSLSGPFGIQCLIGKLSAIIADARLSGRSDQGVILERLLNVSGEDSMEIERKHQKSWSGQLPTRFTVISNELPRLADSSGALAGRLIIFRFTQTFYGKEDLGLTGKLMTELPGILLWAIEGWRRLVERGYFIQPRSSQQLVEEMEDLASPVGAFLRERCLIGPGAEVRTGELFGAWQDWCKEKGRDHPGDEQNFGRNLRAVLPSLDTKSTRRAGEQVRLFMGVELNLRPAFRAIS